MVDFSLVESAGENHVVWEKTAKQKAEKVFKELPPAASKKRKSAVKNNDVSKKTRLKKTEEIINKRALCQKISMVSML